MLNEIEFYADAISERLDNLLRERSILRRELARKTDGTLEREKEFVRMYQENIVNYALYSEKVARLEHILLTR
ncbi:MAG: hypothetical protein IJR35_03790 [Synergistaceae bacterium]|nr:hypothetical protein [Synergistaceae bacterium]MBQ9404105.1 hypothetical protein [Synergistaceae bacterium]MBQ9594959.1 hypothetical protein [Synergistaceae bacterium]MBR0203897.1 hypothetical protein [Synergistaceae bacterium]